MHFQELNPHVRPTSQCSNAPWPALKMIFRIPMGLLSNSLYGLGRLWPLLELAVKSYLTFYSNFHKGQTSR